LSDSTVDSEIQRGPGDRPGPFTFYRPAAWASLLAFLTVGFLITAVYEALHFRGDPNDGALQFFNPLHRLAAGQRPGRDFVVFHGVGVSYFLSPVFRALGGDIFASEILRQLAVVVTFLGGYALVFAAFTRSWTRTVVLTTVAILATMALPLSAILIPGSSILGVRTALPLVLVAVLALPPGRKRMISEGALLGLMPLLTVEQGVAILVAYLVVFAATTVRSGRRAEAACRLALVMIVAATTFAMLLVIIAGPSGMADVVRYGFVDIPRDQFWFFGAPPTSPFDALWRLVEKPDITIMVVVGVLHAVWRVRAVWRLGDRADSRAVALAVLAVFGAVSVSPLLASFIRGYTHGLVRTLLISLLIGLDEHAPWGTTAGSPARPRRWWPEWTALALFVLAIITDTVQTLDVVTAPSIAVLGGFRFTKTMSAEWQTTIRTARSAIARAGPSAGATPIWSTYGGVVEASVGVLNPSRFDYLIHALGDVNRAQYLASFRQARPTIVQTIDPRASIYEEWLETTNWEFYRSLIIGYRAAATGPWSIFWERLASPGGEPRLVNAWSGAPRDQLQMRFATEANGESNLFEVELRYTVINPWRGVPIVGRLPRHYIIVVGGANLLPIPLAPYDTVVRFPVIATNTGGVGLFSETHSLLPGTALRVSSVRVFRYPHTANDMIWVVAFRAAATKSLTRRP
jgi:hypothetical protein